MGILDDAIREHLELKRQHGAESDDLERLENEAFGPATRPGDPEFDTGAEAAIPAPEAEAAAAPEAPLAEDAAPAEAPSTGSTSDWLADDANETSVTPLTDEPAPSAEAARAEHPQLGETADHPAPAPLPEPAAESAPDVEEAPPLTEPLPPDSRTAEPPEAPESSIFDGADLDFGDLEIEEEDDGTVGPQPGGDEPGPFVTDEDDLSLAFEDEVPPTGESSLPPRDEVLRDTVVEEDTGNPPLPISPPAEDPAGGLEEPLPPAEDEPEGEDLLEETPDFLRDTPEGDQAWFEQDPPKDFDFDD